MTLSRVAFLFGASKLAKLRNFRRNFSMLASKAGLCDNLRKTAGEKEIP